MPWNQGSHARKYMIADGEYGDMSSSSTGELVFWGEWEGPSRVLKRWDKADELPRYLQEPYWDSPTVEGFRQNTDPWVFGDAFRYSNCKQLTTKQRPSALQGLTVGSLIIFGSGRPKERRFVLDTIFVVGKINGHFVPNQPSDLPIDERFRVGTVESIATCPPAVASGTFTLYEGATKTRPIKEMFSFAPCLPVESGIPRFARPDIELPGIINPASTQTPAGAKEPRSLDETQATWGTIVEQVLDQDLLLATRIDLK